MKVTKYNFGQEYYSASGTTPYFLIAARNAMAAKYFLQDLRNAFSHYNIPNKLKTYSGWRLITNEHDLNGLAGHVHFIQVDGSLESYKHLRNNHHHYNLEHKRYFDKTVFYKMLINQVLSEIGSSREPYELELY